VNENDAQSFLMDYLDSLGGFVCKIELSGKPIKGKGGSIIKLVPFKNKYYRKGMSDCLYFLNGRFFAIEFKTNEEHRKIKRNIERLKCCTRDQLPKYLHRVKDQYDFIERIKGCGGAGGFASTLGDVKEILK